MLQIRDLENLNPGNGLDPEFTKILSGEANDSLLRRARDTGRDAMGVGGEDGMTILNGNHRAAELLRRAGSEAAQVFGVDGTGEPITWETPIFLKNWFGGAGG